MAPNIFCTKNVIPGIRLTLRYQGLNDRQAVYMPALLAARFNPGLKDKYQKLTARGKPPKVVLTAIMRKLVIFANALIRDDREWSPILD